MLPENHPLVGSMEYEQFLADEKTVDAVLRNLEIIGEAANSISDGMHLQHSNIEWRRIVGLRNIVIHHYFGVDMDII